MDLTNCLFQWIKTFDLKGNCSEPRDLCDGVAITHALVQIAPEHFTSSLLAKIEYRCGGSWFLRVTNLRRIYLSIVEFYSEVLDRGIPEKLQPDLDAICRDYDLKQLAHLLQLILGCAINCVEKEKHIAVMTTLSLELKHGLKVAIDELESFEDGNPHSSVDGGQQQANQQQQNQTSTASGSAATDGQSDRRTITWEEFSKVKNELADLNISKEKTVQRCLDLEASIAKLSEERANLKAENEKLSDKLTYSSRSNIATESTLRFDSIEHETLFQRLTNQINSLQAELSRKEEQMEDYRITCDVKEKEYHKTLLQMEQLQSKLHEFKHDRDELDRLSYLNEEIIRYKNINEVQKKKLEEFQEQKKQIRILEERNASLVKQTCELEVETKSLAVFKGQLEIIKKQRDELRQEASQETFRADKAEDELKRVYTKLGDSSLEKEKMQREVEKLKGEMSGYRRPPTDLMNIGSIDLDLTASLAAAGGGVSTATTHVMDFGENAEATEKLIRLEFENEKLRRELTRSNDGQVRILESQLDDEKSRLEALEAENRSNKQQIIELEGQLKEVKSAKSNERTPTTSSRRSSASDSEVATLQAKLKEMEEEKSGLLSQLDKKTDELAKNEERIKKQILKAKETYEMLETHAQQNTKSLPDTSKAGSEDVAYWRGLAAQREAELEKLRGDFEKTNAFRDMEERLMTVGFHNLSFHLQRKAAEERIYSNSFSTNPTFLSRQRQASSRKFIILPRQWFNKYS